MSVRVTSTGLYAITRRRPGIPEHSLSRAQVSALPAAPGVYIFRDSQRRPLYIGKSIDIRKRVASHLRCMDQAGMLASATEVEALETAGELGALLQEMQLIRALQPPFNAMLLSAESPRVLASARGALQIEVMTADQALQAGWQSWGAFASHHAARLALDALLRQAGLCPGLSGLDPIHPQRGCFAHQLGQCRGACCGAEDLGSYRRRRSRALNKLNKASWPWDGPLGIVEERPGLRQVLVIDGWSYRGMLQASGQPALPRGAFDPEIFRLLERPLAAGVLSVIRIGGSAG